MTNVTTPCQGGIPMNPHVSGITLGVRDFNRANVDTNDWLAEWFEEQRAHLRAVAYLMLGSLSEADDAVQEAWLRLGRSDTSGVGNSLDG